MKRKSRLENADRIADCNQTGRSANANAGPSLCLLPDAKSDRYVCMHMHVNRVHGHTLNHIPQKEKCDPEKKWHSPVGLLQN